LLLAACSAPQPAGSRGESPGRPSRGDHLVYGLQQEPSRLTPQLEGMTAGATISRTIHGYLAVLDDRVELVPELLEEIPSLENGGISADGLSYTCRLRQGLRWHDGAPLTSRDLAFTVAATLDERHPIMSRAGFEQIVGVETPDERTIVYRLQEPYAPFLPEVLSQRPVLPEHLLAGHVGPGFANAPYHRAPVGAGPFRFESWRPGQSVTVVRDEAHWRGAPALERITFRFIPDTSTLFLELQAGGVDLMEGVDADKRDEAAAVPGLRVLVTPTLLFEHLDLNHEHPILADVRVRRALQLGIDREEITEGVFEGVFQPAVGDVHPLLPWASPELDGLVRHDPDEARRLLDEAGWVPGADGVRVRDGRRLELECSTTAGRRLRLLTQQVLQQQLRSLGIDLRIQNHQSTVLFAPHEANGVLRRGRYETALYSWQVGADPNRHPFFHSTQVPPPSGFNHARYRSEEADRLLVAARSAVDPDTRLRLEHERQLRLAADAAVVPLYWRSSIVALDERLQGFRPALASVHTWNAWEWRLR
jgi:peptide/nickel transport system substrate-binding protein